MRTHKPTPGPWKVETDYDLDTGSYWAIESEETGAIVTYMEGDGNEPADAQLIAAAPELLEALRDTTRQMEAMGGRLETGHPGHIDYLTKADAAKWLGRLVTEARAAIAKAEGA